MPQFPNEGWTEGRNRGLRVVPRDGGHRDTLSNAPTCKPFLISMASELISPLLLRNLSASVLVMATGNLGLTGEVLREGSK